MISKERLLHLKTRRDVYNTILENPGIHQRELKRKTKLPMGALIYHIHRLIKNNIITKRCENGYTRYFVANKVDNNDKIIINLLRQKIPRKIVIRLICQKRDNEYTKEEIMETPREIDWEKENRELYNIRLNQTTVNYHLKKLIKAGIVERIKDGRNVRYRLINEDKILDLLIRYKDTFDDFLVYDTLNTFQSKKYNKAFCKSIDDIFDSIKEIFPPPFYM